MAPRLHLVRHAQGLHNLCDANTQIHDPDLTPLGEKQCAELQKKFPHHHGVDLIVSSPIRRTLYTALLSFDNDIKTKNLTIVALPELQETSALPCDTGSDSAQLANEFANYHIDFTHVQPGWNVKTGKWSPEKEAIKTTCPGSTRVAGPEAREGDCRCYSRFVQVLVTILLSLQLLVVSCVLSLLPLPLPMLLLLLLC